MHSGSDFGTRRFYSHLTHDLKNPLIGANRVLELMVEGRVGELTREQCNLLDGLRRSNIEALKLMKDLGDVYKLEKDVNSLTLEETEIVGLVSAVAELFEPLALAHEIAIEKSLPVAMQLCQLDEKAIERVIQNLMDNALKFTPKGGVVALRLFEQNAHAVIEVENSGPGISDADKSASLSDMLRERPVNAMPMVVGLDFTCANKLPKPMVVPSNSKALQTWPLFSASNFH